MEEAGRLAFCPSPRGPVHVSQSRRSASGWVWVLGAQIFPSWPEVKQKQEVNAGGRGERKERVMVQK